MKRILMYLLAFLLISCINTIAEGNTLQKGISGSDVLEIQKVLSSLGYLSSDNVNGIYDDMTELAVLAFQMDNSLEPTGIADLDTQKAITTSNEDNSSELSTDIEDTLPTEINIGSDLPYIVMTRKEYKEALVFARQNNVHH